MADFDFIVVGSGPGGYVAAIRAAQLGLRTAIVEKDERMGGTCLNVGCIPSKVLLEASEAYHHATHVFPTMGVTVQEASFDIGVMMQRKDAVVKQLTDGVAFLMRKNGVEVVRGTGTLVESGLVRVEGESGSSELRAPHICLAMGSVPVELPFMPFDGKLVLSSTHALSLTEVPEHLIVIGAGAIGLELGSVWHRLGAEVTVVEMLSTVAPFADAQASKTLLRALKAQKMKFLFRHRVTGMSVEGDRVRLALHDEKKGEERTLEGDRVLVAVGRRANLQSAGIEQAGVRMERGKVVVDEEFRTNLPGVFAIGDLIRGPMLAHKASEEGVAVAEIAAGKGGHVRYDTIPNVVYTSPELAQVGATEEELKQRGIAYRSGSFLFKANGRAKSLADEQGMVKILADEKTDRILGAHIVGPRASELIAEVATAMEFQGSAEDVGRMTHAHPTLSEVIKEAALAVHGVAIHA